MEEKLSFPVFPRINDESTSKFIHTHSSPQKQGSQFLSTRCQLSLISLVLCYISVHFAILRCSCQIFPLNESFNALLDDYRTREESCSQLLCDLWNKQNGTKSVLHTLLSCHYSHFITLIITSVNIFCLLHCSLTKLLWSILCTCCGQKEENV